MLLSSVLKFLGYSDYMVLCLLKPNAHLDHPCSLCKPSVC